MLHGRLPVTVPVTRGDPHHSEEDNKEDEEPPGHTVHNGRGDGVGEGVIGHSSTS